MKTNQRSNGSVCDEIRPPSAFSGWEMHRVIRSTGPSSRAGRLQIIRLRARPISKEDIVDDFSVDIGQTKVSSLKFVG